MGISAVRSPSSRDIPDVLPASIFLCVKANWTKQRFRILADLTSKWISLLSGKDGGREGMEASTGERNGHKVIWRPDYWNIIKVKKKNVCKSSAISLIQLWTKNAKKRRIAILFLPSELCGDNIATNFTLLARSILLPVHHVRWQTGTNRCTKK